MKYCDCRMSDVWKVTPLIGCTPPCCSWPENDAFALGRSDPYALMTLADAPRRKLIACKRSVLFRLARESASWSVRVGPAVVSRDCASAALEASGAATSATTSERKEGMQGFLEGSG